MNVLMQLLGEFSMIAFALGFFIYLTGIKVACPHCGARFYYQKNQSTCPSCERDLETTEEATVEETEPELETYVCYNCGFEVATKVDQCPQCSAWIGQSEEDEPAANK